MPLPFATRTKIKAKEIYKRITQSRLTTCLFLFTFTQCFSQAIMYSFLFTVDASYFNFLHQVANASHFTQAAANFTYPPSVDSSLLLMCDFIEFGNQPAFCETVFDPAVDIDITNAAAQDPKARGDVVLQIMNGVPGMIYSGYNSSYSGVPIPVASRTYNESIVPVTLSLAGGDSVVLNPQCIQILSYPLQHLQTAEREDLTWLFLQFWLFIMTFMGLLWDSTPHIVAVITVRFLPACWSVYAIWRTLHQKDYFYSLVEQAGTPCSLEMFTEYFKQRISLQAADTALSLLSLGVGAYFTWNLVKIYNTQACRTLGASDAIMHMYKLFHGLQTVLYVEAFVLVASIALWIDQFFNSYMGHSSEHTKIYEMGFLFTIIMILPWLIMGWVAIKREWKWVMVGFLLVATTFLAGWSAMYDSQIYRWTFLAWPYVACYTVISEVLLVVSIVLGVICWRNFGKGLAQYMHAEAALQSSNFTSDSFEHDVEKHGVSYDSEALEFPLNRSNSGASSKFSLSKLSMSRLSIGSFAAGTMSPVEVKDGMPLPTFYSPDGTPGGASRQAGLAPLRRMSQIG